MNKLYILLLGLLFFNACGENAFEQIVEIDIPPHESRLAVSTIVLSTQDSISVFVSNSLGILDTNEFSDSRTAEVNLLKDGVIQNAFSYDPDFGRYVNKLSDVIGAETAEYRLEVQDESYPKAISSQRMPLSPEIVSISLEREGTLDDTGERVDEIIIEINDAANDKAFYAVRGYLIGEVELGNGEIFEYRTDINLESNNPLTVSTYQSNLGLLISDASFDGTSYKLNTWTYFQIPEDQPDLRLLIELINITEDTYLYTRSLDQYYDALDNPFAEPVTIHSNFEDGYGIFGLGNVTTFEIEIE